MNCAMVKRALCVALGLVGAFFPAAAQQTYRPEWPVGGVDPAFSLNLFQPRISAAGGSFFLFRHSRRGIRRMEWKRTQRAGPLVFWRQVRMQANAVIMREGNGLSKTF